MDDTVFIMIGLLTLVLVLSFMRRRILPAESFMPNLPFMKTKLYWFVDAESNARNWWDFHSRRSMLPNRGYLQVALEALQRTQGDDFQIVPLIGRMDTMAAMSNPLPRAIDLPPALWRSYVISHLCANQGGLVIDGNSVLTLGPSFKPLVNSISAAMFGTDHDEPVVNPTTDIAPGPDQYIGYASTSGHPAWIYAAKEYDALVARGPQAWSSAVVRRMPRALWDQQLQLGMSIIRAADGSRLEDGKLRQLEDYFGRVSNPTNPRQTLTKDAVYVAYDGDDLVRRYEFGWFNRLSPQQIKESDLVWTQYAGL